MSYRRTIYGVAAAIAALVSATVGAADTFSFQGVLADGGAPADGIYDLKFRLHDVDSGGAPLGDGELTVDDVLITDGLVTIDLDFGMGVFDGGARWLEIDIKADADVTYTTLSPRQPLTPTPYAHYAYAAAGIGDGGLPAVYTDPISFTSAGNAFTGNGAGLASLNANAIITGNLNATHLPTGGSWALSNALNVNSGSLFIDPVTSAVGIGTATPDSSFDLTIGDDLAVGSGPTRVLIHGGIPGIAGYGADTAIDFFIRSSGTYGLVELFDETSNNNTVTLSAGDDTGGRLELTRRDGASSVDLAGDSGSSAGYLLMTNHTGTPTIFVNPRGGGDDGARAELRNSAGLDSLVLDADGAGSRIWTTSATTTSGDHAVHGVLSAAAGAAQTAAVRGENQATNASGYGVWGSHAGQGNGVRGTTSGGAGVYAENLTGNGAAVAAFDLNDSGVSFGVSSITASTEGRAVVAESQATSGVNYALWASNSSSAGYAGYFPQGRSYFADEVGFGTDTPSFPVDVVATGHAAVQVFNDGSAGIGDGVVVTTTDHAGYGLWSQAIGGSSANAVRAEVTSATAYAGYFVGGRNYFEGDVGIGTTTPGAPLDVRTAMIVSPSSNLANIELLASSSRAELRTFGRTTGQVNVLLGSGGATDDLGFVGIADEGGVFEAQMFIDSATGNGTVEADVKNFRVPNPDDAATDIVYACIEGPEAAMYVRGTGMLVGGTAFIDLPRHFATLASAEGMTVHLTPLSAASKGLAVVSKSPEMLEVVELMNGLGTYEFDWEVKAVRRDQVDYEVVRPWNRNLPSSDLTEQEQWQRRLAEIERREQRLLELEERLGLR